MTDLPAGPELDALVAKKVMGLKYRKCTCGPDHIAIDGRSPSVHFNPSTNIAHTWEVVDMMSKKGLEIRIRTSTSGTSRWLANIDDQPINEIADTAPLAICLAALKAVRP